ncbi:MAG: hypothetical protein COA30_02175 [Sulfurimonas sp.]|nr:MAG: hypothetical protein COA30_02175 [Sulfurimonas sp.]
MINKKLVSEDTLDFQKILLNYIKYDKDTNTKIISNINFKELLLNTSSSSHHEVDEQGKYLNQLELDNNIIENNISHKIENIIFQNCDFSQLAIGILNCNIQFKDCNIEYFTIANIEYTPSESYTINIDCARITTININSKDIIHKLYFNKYRESNKQEMTVDYLFINNVIFHENFKLHNCVIEAFEMNDTDFMKNADFFMSVFKNGTLVESKKENISKDDIGFKAINFESLALFGDTEFHKKLIFKYVTFKGHNHFKSALLHKGLDLEYTNIQNEMNFYGLTILDTSTTSQETYRIIKHQFEKLGNKIEANKYHALELNQRRKNLQEEEKSFSNCLDRIVFFFHHWSSWHSTNWAFPLFWIIILSIVTHFLVDNLVCYKCTHHSSWLDYFRYMSIVNLDDCLKYNPLIFLFNKVTLGYLYYQFLTSVRKDTRK